MNKEEEQLLNTLLDRLDRYEIRVSYLEREMRKCQQHMEHRI